MRADQLHLQAPDPRRHTEALIDLIAKCFADETNGYYSLRDACRHVYLKHSHYDWNCSRIGLLGDRLITHYGVWKYTMRLGAARVLAGGIGAVATEADFRKRGYMDLTLQASLESMRAQGYDLTLLFGIDSFYRRYGYVRAWTEVNYYARVVDLPRDRPTGPIYKFAVRPRADLAELYNAHHAETTGTAVRPTYLRANESWHGKTEGYLWKQDGVPTGYVVLARNGSKLRCLEYAGDAMQALRVVAERGRKLNSGEIHFATLPHQSMLLKLLRRNNCRTESRYQRDGGAMVRVLNLASTLQKMEDELSRRMQESPLAGWRGSLLLSGKSEQATLKITRGRVAVAPGAETAHAIWGGDEIAQLVLGTEAPEEVMEAGRMEVTGDAARLADVLFPAQHPQLSQLDRF